MQFSAILVRTPEKTLCRSFARPLHADGPLGRAHHSTSFIAYGYVRHSCLSFALQHHKACRETKWTIRDKAPLASSKQISISIEAPLNSGTSWMVWDGKWATTHGSTLFETEVCPYFLPGSTLVFDIDCFRHC